MMSNPSGTEIDIATVTTIDDRTLIVTTSPGLCTGCRTAHLLFINYQGRTACMGCTAKKLEKRS